MKKILLFSITIIINLSLQNANAQWEPDVRLTNDTATSLVTGYHAWNVAASGDTIHIVFNDNRYGNDEIFYKRSIDGGSSWEPDTRLTNDTAISRTSCIAVSGSFINISWYDTRDGNFEIYYKRSTDGGNSWEPDTRLTNDTSVSYQPSIAASGLNVHVVWTELWNGNLNEYYKSSTDGGISWGKETKLTDYPGTQLNISISVSGSFVHVVWNGGSGKNIYYKRSTDFGLFWESDIQLTNTAGRSQAPSISSYGSTIHIVWFDYRDGNYEIYYKRSTDNGLTWDEDIRLSNSTSKSYIPNIASSGLGVHIVWQDIRNGIEDIFYICSTDGGISWSVDTLLVDNSSTKSSNASIAVSGSAVHLVWYDMRDIPNGEIYYKRNPTGNPKTGIVDLKISKIQLTSYPNPTSNILNLHFDNLSQIDLSSIKIYSLFGSEIKLNVKSISESNIEYDVSSIPQGIYFVNVSIGDRVERMKFVKINN